MLRTVSNYITYLSRIKEYIDESPYKTNFFYESLGMNKQTFYRKLKEQAFSPVEVQSISKILFPSELLLMELENSNADKEAGRVVEHSEAMRILRKKHL